MKQSEYITEKTTKKKCNLCYKIRVRFWHNYNYKKEKNTIHPTIHLSIATSGFIRQNNFFLTHSPHITIVLHLSTLYLILFHPLWPLSIYFHMYNSTVVATFITNSEKSLYIKKIEEKQRNKNIFMKWIKYTKQGKNKKKIHRRQFVWSELNQKKKKK